MLPFQHSYLAYSAWQESLSHFEIERGLELSQNLLEVLESGWEHAVATHRRRLATGTRSKQRDSLWSVGSESEACFD